MCSYSVIVHLSRVHCLRGDDFSCDHHFKHEAAGSSPALSAKFLGFDREPVNWVFIRAVLASVAEIAIVPRQDGLGLGSEARMNLAGHGERKLGMASASGSLDEGCYSTFYGTLPCFMLAEQGGLTP